MADDNRINQDEIERLLSQNQGVAPAAKDPPAAAPPPSAAFDQSAIESMLAESKGKSQAPPAPAQPAAALKTPLASGNDDKLLAQEEIESLLQQAGKAGPATAVQSSPEKKNEATASSLAGEGAMVQSDVEYLLHQAEQALASIAASNGGELPQGVSAFRLEEFAGAPASTETATLDLIRDVELDLKIELGRTHMYLEDVLKLRRGSVVPLDKLAGDPVDIYVNGRLIARGEVLVLNDNFCVRVAELIAGTNVFA